MTRIVVAVVIAALGMSGVAEAQQRRVQGAGVVHGVVVAADTEVPMVGTMVVLRTVSDSTSVASAVTNEEGRFRLAIWSRPSTSSSCRAWDTVW